MSRQLPVEIEHQDGEDLVRAKNWALIFFIGLFSAALIFFAGMHAYRSWNSEPEDYAEVDVANEEIAPLDEDGVRIRSCPRIPEDNILTVSLSPDTWTCFNKHAGRDWSAKIPQGCIELRRAEWTGDTTVYGPFCPNAKYGMPENRRTPLDAAYARSVGTSFEMFVEFRS